MDKRAENIFDTACAREVWDLCARSLAWFRLVDSMGLVKQWLGADDDDVIDRVFMMLGAHQDKIPDRVAELLEPYAEAGGKWEARLLSLAIREVHTSRKLFELFLRLIANGAFDGSKTKTSPGRDFWLTIYSLPKNNPAWACEAIGHYLQRHLKLTIDNGQKNPFDREAGTIPDSQVDDQVLLESGNKAPRDFVTAVLPFMERVWELTAERQNDRPWKDPVWHRFYGSGYSLDQVLLAATERALMQMAQQEPSLFAPIAAQLKNSDFEAAQFLLVRAYAANGMVFADEAVAYLCENAARLKTGYISGPDGSHWATRLLIETVSPYCSNDKLLQLENSLLGYYTEWERRKEGRRARGYTQLLLLKGIVSSRRSDIVRQRIAEWRRKFGRHAIDGPELIEMQDVSSPVPEAAAERMTDDQWLTAIARYSSRDDTWKQHGQRLLGGAHELSQVLENQVKKDPARFAKLVCFFPDTAHPFYFNAALRGLTGKAVNIDLIRNVCERCHRLPGRPCGQWMVKLIAGLAKEALPEDLIKIVIWYAIEDSDPESELWRTEAPSGGVYYGGDIITAAINSVRGSAAEAIAQLIFHDGKRLSYLRSALEQIVNDRSIAVRSCVATVLVSVLRYDRALAVALFKDLCNAEDQLLGTRYVEQFIFYASRTHFSELRAIMERMLSSEHPLVQIAGARQICVASLTVAGAQKLADMCVSGTEAHRQGAAEVFAANLKRTDHRDFCEQSLGRLFFDPAKTVRAAAASCFRHLIGDSIVAYPNLITKFIQSPAFVDSPLHLLMALEETTAHVPKIICDVIERFLDIVASDRTYPQSGAGLETAKLSQLLIRAYSQTGDKNLRSRCLDMIDRMIAQRLYGFNEALATYER